MAEGGLDDQTPFRGPGEAVRLGDAELVTGDLDDPESLRAAMRGAYGAFSVQPANLADPQPEAGVRQGNNVADAAKAVGVAHLVYSSVGCAERKSGVAHFESKAEIEAYIDALGVPATVLRPVFFMENWSYLVPEAHNGERVAQIALDADTSLQMIALTDIGRIAANAFDRPEELVGKKIEIAGDELTVRQIAEVFTEADGIPTRFERQPIEAQRAEEVANMFKWLNEKGYQADIAALREWYSELLTFVVATGEPVASVRAWVAALGHALRRPPAVRATFLRGRTAVVRP